MTSDLINITVEIEAETLTGVLVHTGDKEKAVWLPRSQIELEPHAPNSKAVFTLTLPDWLAIKKGLI